MPLRFVPLAVLAATLGACAPSRSVALDLRRFEAPSPDGPVVYYLGRPPGTPERTSALLYLRGTGAEPASVDFGKAAETTLFGYDIAYPERGFVADPSQFLRADHRPQRLSEAVAVFDQLVAGGVERVLLFAESEATMFAPELAMSRSSKTVALVCVAGSLAPFAEDLLWTAAHPQQGRRPTPLGSDELRSEFDRIRSAPLDTETTFWGHTYRFWSSYLDVDAASHLRQARFPILYVNGENDEVDLERQAETVARLRSDGVDVEQRILKGAGHQLEGAASELAETIVEWARRKGLVQTE